MTKDKGGALPPAEDRAVVNGAGQAVSALRASVPSAMLVNMLAAHDRAGADCPARKRSLGATPCPKCGAEVYEGCRAEARAADAFVEAVRWALYAPEPKPLLHEYKPHLKYPWFCGECGYPEHERLKHPAQAIEARRAETGTGSVHESAVGNADAPESPTP